MDYPNLTSFINSEGRSLAKGPIALLFIEDDVEVETTLDHHIKLGFKQIIVLAKSFPEVDEDTLTQVTTVYVDTFADDCVERTVNTLMPHLAGAWVYVGFNAEYLFSRFPVRARLRNCWPFIPKNAVDLCWPMLLIYMRAI